MRRWFAVVLAFAACHRSAPRADVDPVTATEARAFAETLIATVTPACEIPKIDPLVDHAALAARFADRASTPGLRTNVTAEVFERRHSGATILCSWFGTDAQMRVLSVGANGQPLVRKLIKLPGAKAGVGYYRLELGRSRTDGKVRIVDAYSYLQGAWLTEVLSQIVEAAQSDGVTGALDFGAKMKQIQALRAAKKPAEALAIVDALPATLLQVRHIQMMRVGIAKEISTDAYHKALDELAHAFPNDPAVAMIEIDGALLRGDPAEALRDIDLIDHEVGGDPFQDTVRSTIYLRQHDLASADAHATAAIAGEPTLPGGYRARFEVAIAQQQWQRAVDTMDALAKLHVPVSDAALRGSHTYDDFVASPEYAAWHANHP